MSPVPCVTAEQMRTVDRLATGEYRLRLLQMMENAGRHFAHLVREELLERAPSDHTVLVLCGSGGNGGKALVAARGLHGWGANVRVGATISPDDYTGIPAHQRALLRRLEVPVRQIDPEDNLPEADLLLDALIGYGLDGEPRDEMADVIRQVIWHAAPVLSLDVPFGLDATTGVPSEATVHAEATLTPRADSTPPPHGRPSAISIWTTSAFRPPSTTNSISTGT